VEGANHKAVTTHRGAKKDTKSPTECSRLVRSNASKDIALL
jgi:hypothetical protein